MYKTAATTLCSPGEQRALRNSPDTRSVRTARLHTRQQNTRKRCRLTLKQDTVGYLNKWS